MSSFQKVAFSFLSAVVLFAGFVFLAQVKLIGAIETKFYAQSKIAENQKQLDSIAEACDLYIKKVLTTFQTGENAYLNSSDVRSYVYLNPSEKVETNRRNFTNKILSDFPALDGIRLVEKNGRNVNFSTIETDILETEGLIRKYKNYPDLKDDANYLEPSLIFSDEFKPERKILFDGKDDLIIFSFPFYKNDDTYFGVLLCYFDVRSIVNALYDEHLLSPSMTLSLIASEDYLTGGFVAGIPSGNKEIFGEAVIKKWLSASLKSGELDRLFEAKDGSVWLMLSSLVSEKLHFSGVYSNSVYELSHESILLIYICVFMTILLVAFLLFSLKRDYMTIIRARIKKVQFGIINEYLRNKEDVEWLSVAKQMEYRKLEFCEEIKKSIGGNSKKHTKEVEAYLDSSWDEIISILYASSKKSYQNNSDITLEDIRRVVEEVLQNANINVNLSSAQNTKGTEVKSHNTKGTEIKSSAETKVTETKDDQEIEDLEDLEDVDDLEDAEEVEDLEDVDDLEDAEADTKVTEIKDDQEIEDLEDLEDVDDLEDAEEVEDLEDVDDLEDAEEIEDLEDVDDLEEVEEADDLKKKSSNTKVTEINDGDDVESLEELDELEEVVEEPFKYIPPAANPAEDIYEDCPESYCRKDDLFASVENLFGEELCIGNEYTPEEQKFNYDFIFNVYMPNFMDEGKSDTKEDSES
ncbi:MAG: hypothetical protein K5829_03195 [Treponema sp.]|nr:hypothetical protein [Treponema sp.]